MIDFSFVQATFAEIVSESLIDEVKDAVTNMVSSIDLHVCVLISVSILISLPPPPLLHLGSPV